MEIIDSLDSCYKGQYLNGIHLIQATYSWHPQNFNTLVDDEAILSRWTFHYKNMTD